MAVRIKICGITRCEDAELAVGLGADFIGLNFYPPSPRCLTLEPAAAIARVVKGRARLVGVFVNAARAYIKERLESLDLDLLQFHGDEDDGALRRMAGAGDSRAAAALRCVARRDRYRREIKADFILIDTFHPRLFGGTGQARRLDALGALDLSRVFVSGGLTPDNAAEAAALNPYALDVASGVEAAPGIKDPRKLGSFIANARTSKSSRQLETFARIYPRLMQSYPDKRGHFGEFGGRYVAETLMPALAELESAYRAARRDPAFRAELERYSREYVGRPTPLYFAANLTAKLGGAKIYLKREDLCHTGAHKVNNTLGQALLAVRMGKARITAETGAGQHGVATATMAALFRRECEVFMGSVDVERQSLNVFRMKLLGAKVTAVDAGSRSLKDALNEALRDWIATVAQHLLPHRHRRRAASVPDDRARLPVGDRARGAPPDSQARGPPARRAGRLRQRRLQRDRALLSVPRGQGRAHVSASRRADWG